MREKLDEVLQALVDAENIDILVERELLIYTSDAVDITQRVIDDLNTAISTTPVERVRAPEPEAGEAGASE